MFRGRRAASAYVSVLLLCCLVTVGSRAGVDSDEHAAQPATKDPRIGTKTVTDPPPAVTVENASETASMATLPGGGTKIFGRNRFLVAYYGTAGTDALGVLGEHPPDQMHRRLRRAAREFKHRGEQILPVHELIVTIADATPGKDGDYNHDISRRAVRSYIKAAERNGAVVVLDIQPGRADFLTVAKRWEWALEHPLVGLALDPEWRMGSRQVPGRVIGSVRANEVNRVSAWLDRLTRRQNLPEKVFMLHQFRGSMIVRPERVVDRPRLAEVLHVDGFGTPSQKLDTYRALARPRQFKMGFKLFYDEDVPRMRARAVRKIQPKVRFVSFQ